MNKVTLIGRITKDLELKKTTSGKSVLQFTLAVNRMDKTADFINITAWEQRADFLMNYAHKGNRISVVGELRVETYEKDGKTNYKTYVNAQEVEILESKRDEEPTYEKPTKPSSQTLEVEDDTLPF